MHEELLLFIEKADRMESSSFWEWLRHNRFKARMDEIVAGNWLAYEGFTQDALDAFCLNLRLLIQDRDGFSIRRVSEISASWPDKYSKMKQEIAEARETLNKKLSERALVQIFDAKETTYKDLFDVIFYGGIAHCDVTHRALFRKITDSGIFSHFVFSNFADTVIFYRNCIVNIAYNVIQYLRGEGRYP